MNEHLIDFNKFGGPVYVGRANGMRARKRIGADNLDQLNDVVVVRIPDSTYSVNSSFFLGLFGPSLERFGTREEFMRHYKIEAPSHIAASLVTVIDRTLAGRGRLAVSA